MLRRLTALVLMAGSAATGLTAVADGDVFWHLAAGRELWLSGQLLQRDPFSSGATGRPWVDVHWLFQLGVYGAHALGGLRALVWCKCLLIAASVLVLHAALPRRARALYAVIAIASLFCARHLLLVRPVIVTLLMLALFFLLLERFRRDADARLLAPLPLLQIVWSNCQGLSALGPALIAAYLIAAAAQSVIGGNAWYPFAPESGGREDRGALVLRARLLLLALIACTAASLVTPYGLRALVLPAELLARLLPHANNPYAQVAENVPPFALERELPGQLWHLPWFLALLALSFALSRRGLLLSHALLVLGLVALALIANRNVLLLYFVAAPIAARQLNPAIARARFALRRFHARAALRVATAGTLGLLLLATGSAAQREPSFARPTPFRFPEASAALLAQRGGEGAIFAADQSGGYLIWQLYPRFRPYMDTRLVLRSADEYAEYLELAEQPYRFDAFARREHISHVVLPVGYPDRYLRLIAQLYQSAQWTLLFTDGSEVLFARSDRTREPALDLSADATSDRILARAARRFAGEPRLLAAARLQLASLQIAVGAFRQAQRSLSRERSPSALALRARAYLAAGEPAQARALAERLLRAHGDDARTFALLAQSRLHAGRSAEALVALGRALAADPFDPEATRLLAALEEPP